MDTINKQLIIDNSWTLFLDRDGIINVRLEGYVRTPDEFIYKKDFLEAYPELRKKFSRIFVVTNQAGIGKGLMTEMDFDLISNAVYEKTDELGGKIDKIYYCPHLKDENCDCRKPKPGMAYFAKNDFPEIDFKKSIMVGDTMSDIEFGNFLGMKTVLIPSKEYEAGKSDYLFDTLLSFAKIIKSK